MIVSVFNGKGGVGKTPIAFSLAKDLNAYLISNDDSIIEEAYPDRALIVEEPQLIEGNVVYDFGGYIDKMLAPILKESDCIVVPTNNDYNALKKTLATLEELLELKVKGRICVAATKLETQKDLDSIREKIEGDFPAIKVFQLRKSKAYSNAIESGLSIRELYNDSPQNQHAYRNVYPEYKLLLRFVAQGE